MLTYNQGGVARPIDISKAVAKAEHEPKARTDSTSSALEAHEEDGEGLEVLDEDGKPYFEPLDMDKMAIKYANMGPDLTQKNGIHGFWR